MGDQHNYQILSLGHKIGKLECVAAKCPDCGHEAVIVSEQLVLTPERIIAPGQAQARPTSGVRYTLCLWCFRREKLEMDVNLNWTLVETHPGTPPEEVKE